MTAQARKWLYLITGLVAAIVPIFIAVGLIDTGQGENVNNLMLSLSSLLGAGGATVAAGVTHRQQKEGLHDPALPPADQAIESLKKVAEQQQQANADMDRLKDMATSILAGTTGVVTGAVVDAVTGGGQSDDPLQAILRNIHL